jgi:hypothetical protein
MAPEAQAAITELQKQLAKQNKLLAEAMQSLAEERLKVKARDGRVDVEAFDADTRRLSVVKDMIPMDSDATTRLIRETVRQALQDNLGPVRGSTAPDLASDAASQPLPGAEMAGVPRQQLSADSSPSTPP